MDQLFNLIPGKTDGRKTGALNQFGTSENQDHPIRVLLVNESQVEIPKPAGPDILEDFLWRSIHSDCRTFP